jgi:uncharacterized protein with PIN domain
MIKVIKKEPAPAVIKEVVCPSCGVTLQYVPNDIQNRQVSDYTGDTDTRYFIRCPECKKEVVVRGY